MPLYCTDRPRADGGSTSGSTTPIVSRAKKTGTAKGRKRLKTASNGRALRQIAALAYRIAPDGGIEFLMMSSRETRRFVIPKGWPMKGRKPWKSAQIEARQEAGVVGEIARRRIGQYRYWKRMEGFFALVEVAVYPMRVKRQLAEWPERHERAQRWLRPADAALLVDEPDLGDLIRSFAAGFPDPERPPPETAPEMAAAAPTEGLPSGGADAPEALRPKARKGKAAKKAAAPRPVVSGSAAAKTKTAKAKAAAPGAVPTAATGSTDQPAPLAAAITDAPTTEGHTKSRTRKSRAKKRPSRTKAAKTETAKAEAAKPVVDAEADAASAARKKAGKAKSSARKPRKRTGKKPSPAATTPEAGDG